MPPDQNYPTNPEHTAPEKTSVIETVVDKASRPLCVDLDGTLCFSDLLYEGILSLIRQNPAAVFSLAWELRNGKAALKTYLANNSQLAVSELPWRPEVLAMIQEARSMGSKVVLATATHETLANKVAAHLGCFDEVCATSDTTNLKGVAKAEMLTARFGVKGFDYIGDCAADVPVWEAAHVAYVVDNNLITAPSIVLVTLPQQPETNRNSKLTVLRKAIRVHQWSKNLLLLLPLIFAHKLNNLGLVATALMAVMSFSLCASAVYLINDLMDLPSDRRHPTKRFRPLAAGSMTIPNAAALVCWLLAGAVLLALPISLGFLGMLLLYFTITLLYSVALKRLLVIDILVLALLYTIRVYAGGVAINVHNSPWLLAFSMFFFLSLGAVKRFVELNALAARGGDKVSGRGYLASDGAAMQSVGLASGVTSVMVLALYITSPSTTQMYHTPDVLLLSGPLVLYWILRVWFLAARGEVVEDPVLFALTDVQSYAVGIIGAMIVFLAAM